MGMTSLNISLPQSLKEHIEKQVDAGHYSTPSEYVREILREDVKRKSVERVEALVLEGLQSQTSEVVDAKYWSRMQRELAARRSRREKARKPK